MFNIIEEDPGEICLGQIEASVTLEGLVGTDASHPQQDIVRCWPGRVREAFGLVEDGEDGDAELPQEVIPVGGTIFDQTKLGGNAALLWFKDLEENIKQGLAHGHVDV